MWHVSSCSGVATLQTAIHLLLAYLLNFTCVVDKSKIAYFVFLQDFEYENLFQSVF